ncbi:MAG: DUF2244 domain-containing protein [Nevskiaceae bacterium]|jgi:uncharacterized membrane protein|nr:DUF2244 domain-containing protein [Nevskiaceae bacterium]
MDSSTQCIRLCPRNALTPRQARSFLLFVGSSCLGLATFLALKGFWPVLPFAGLEVAALWFALTINRRREQQVQTILVSDDEIRVRKHDPVHTDQVLVFPRYWSRVKLRRSAIASHPSHLVIESGGQSCEVGEFLTEVQRQDLAGRLHRLVGPMSEAPVLGPATDVMI